MRSPPIPAAAPRDHPEQQEHAAAQEIEGEELAQRLGLDDEAVEAEADQSSGAEPEQDGLAHRARDRTGGPATSNASAATASVLAISMTMISGLA